MPRGPSGQELMSPELNKQNIGSVSTISVGLSIESYGLVENDK